MAHYAVRLQVYLAINNPHYGRFNTIYDLFMMDPIGFTLPLLFGINDHIQIVRWAIIY